MAFKELAKLFSFEHISLKNMLKIMLPFFGCRQYCSKRPGQSEIVHQLLWINASAKGKLMIVIILISFACGKIKCFFYIYK
jgi:hypothetical protein